MPAADHRAYPVRVVAERLGIPVATLRSWNQRYGIGPQQRSPGRHRLYSEADIVAAQRMLELVRTGTSPAAAARIAVTPDSVPAPADTVAPLLNAAFRLDASDCARLLDAQLRRYGVLATWEGLCRPAFAEIVRRQGGGEGCVDVEHLLSWSIIGALYRGAPPPGPSGAPLLLLACTPKEQHSLPLEVLRAALAETGRPAHMLGPDLPVAALREALGRPERAVIVVLWAHSPDTANLSAIEVGLDARAEVFAAGPGWPDALPGAVRRLHELDAAVAQLS
ncbi:MerR family transcriptional regulator [Nocardia huaxiensis]|uniref:MerR family transcriptional regulator n=1 Tax=Nocardia huaxiensis TaxID=2755382 RepID=A0A7D6V6I4_9NOCA|nr:MerR family transcriptional regulator [Nocardia huaxiensis]QLY28701.1 MerR family transcriptional regulator [Nocardia huaxiensis]